MFKKLTALIIGILLVSGMAEAIQPVAYRYHQLLAVAVFPRSDPLVVEVIIDKAEKKQMLAI